MAAQLSTFAWKIPWTEEPTVHGVAKSRTRLSNFTFFLSFLQRKLHYLLQDKKQDFELQSSNVILQKNSIIFIHRLNIEKKIGGSDGKASAYNAGDPGSIPVRGRSPGEGNGNPLQYSCLENPMDGGAWRATVHGVPKSRTRLSDFTFLTLLLYFEVH